MVDIAKINGIDIANIAKINGIDIANIAKFGGQDVPAGGLSGNTEFVYNSASTSTQNLDLLSSTEALIIYRDNGNSGHGTAQALGISEGTISGNDEFVFNAATTNDGTISAISSSKAIISYLDGGNSSKATAQILDISSSTVTGNTERVLDNNDFSTDTTIDLINSSTASICYKETNTTAGEVEIVTISGGIISSNTAFIFSTDIATSLSIQAISTTKAVIVYRDAGDSDKGTSQILTIDGTGITGNAEFDYEPGATFYNSLSLIDSSTQIVAYKDEGNSNFGTSQILDIGSTTISGNTTFVFVSAQANWVKVDIIDSTKALVVSSDAVGTVGSAQVLAISSGTITGSDAFDFNTGGSTDNLSLKVISSSAAIVSYRDNGNSGVGTAQILNF